jgi:hypothetical protein
VSKNICFQSRLHEVKLGLQINLFGLLPEKVFISVQILGNSLEKKGRRLFGGNWFGSLLLFQSKLLLFGWLCKTDLAL